MLLHEWRRQLRTGDPMTSGIGRMMERASAWLIDDLLFLI